MLLEILGFKKAPVSDITWIQVAQNIKTNEQMNNVILIFQVNSIFELFFDIIFLAITCVLCFGIIFLLKKVTYLKYVNILRHRSKLPN